MKKTIVAIITVALTLGFSTFVLADQSLHVILDPIESQEYSTFPQTLDVTGTVTGDKNAELDSVTLFVNGHKISKQSLNDTIGKNGCDFLLNWDISDPGSYDVKVVAKSDGISASDEQDVEITLEDEEEDNGAINKAAPAVAAKLLKESGIKHHYEGGNYISDVAREFEVEEDSDAAYEEQINSFLIEKGADLEQVENKKSEKETKVKGNNSNSHKGNKNK